MSGRIQKAKEGSLRRIAAREGGIKADGRISKTWARRKLSQPGTHKSTKKKILFFLNFNK